MNHYSPKEMLELMLSHLGLPAEVVEEQRPSGPTLHILDEDALFLVGSDGSGLEDLQYLLNRMIASEDMSEQSRISIDIAGHRLREQSAFLLSVAEQVNRVRTDGVEITLEPMNSYERMMVHNTYKSDPEIETTSPDGPERIKQITVRRRT